MRLAPTTLAHSKVRMLDPTEFPAVLMMCRSGTRASPKTLSKPTVGNNKTLFSFPFLFFCAALIRSHGHGCLCRDGGNAEGIGHVPPAGATRQRAAEAVVRARHGKPTHTFHSLVGLVWRPRNPKLFVFRCPHLSPPRVRIQMCEIISCAKSAAALGGEAVQQNQQNYLYGMSGPGLLFTPREPAVPVA